MSIENATMIKKFLDDNDISCYIYEYRYDGIYKYHINITPSYGIEKITIFPGYGYMSIINIQSHDNEILDKYFKLGYIKMCKSGVVKKYVNIRDNKVINELQIMSHNKGVNIKRSNK